MKNLLEWSLQFDLLWNNIMSNKAPGLNAYEKSSFLTQAQLGLIKDVFTPKANVLQEGIDDSARRQADFRSLITNAQLSSTTPLHRFNTRSTTKYYAYPSDAFLVLSEELAVGDKYMTVVPLSREEYARLMQKPYKYPVKGQVWRLDTDDNKIELIANFPAGATLEYKMRYVKYPSPIILENLPSPLTIEGKNTATDCVLPEHLHDEILQRAVLLAKLAWNDPVAAKEQ